MEIFNKIAPFKAFLEGFRRSDQAIGLVPTMGALHNGHLALISSSKRENLLTICTIYVNPSQFNNPSDLQKYPRNLDQDLALLRQVDCDVVFCPETEEMYSESSYLKFDFGHLDKVMEGKFRPGHFSGVALVVSKLFNLVQPHHAYFGQKDWQQFVIINQLVAELKFGLSLHFVPTFREHDGLAMSSRNQRLKGEQRQKAIVFYHALQAARESLNSGMDLSAVRNVVTELIENTEGVELEYFEVAESKNLNVLEIVKGADKPIMCIAGYVGDIRLIDNMFLE